MAVRVTADEVKVIIETTLTDLQIGTFITGANVLVNDRLGTGATEILKQIELWLTAHLIAVSRERQASKEGAGGANVEYAGRYSETGLNSTSYGQTALSLDTSGTLAALGGKTASIRAITSFD